MQREDRHVDGGAGMPVDVGERRIDRPTDARAGRLAEESRAEQQCKGRHEQPELMLLSRGKAMSGAPIMIGTNQLPKPPIIAGMTMKNTMIRPWAVMMTL